MNFQKVESNERAVSPVVGVALLIGITVILAAVIGTVVLGVGVGSAAAPQVTLSFEVVDDEVEVYHEGGDALDGDEVVVLNESGEVIHELEDGLSTGQSKAIADEDDVERVSVVWQDSRGDSETVLATFRP